MDILASSDFWINVCIAFLPSAPIWVVILILSYTITFNEKAQRSGTIAQMASVISAKHELGRELKALSTRVDAISRVVSPRKLQHGTVCERCGCDINVDDEKLSYDDLNFYNAEVTCPACGSVSIFTMQVANVVCCRED